MQQEIEDPTNPAESAPDGPKKGASPKPGQKPRKPGTTRGSKAGGGSSGRARSGTASGTRGRAKPAESGATEGAAALDKPRRRTSTAAAKAVQAAATSGNGAKPRARIMQRFLDETAPVLTREFGYSNPMQVPKPIKAVLNISLGEAIANSNAVEAAVGDLATITGQRPVVTRARVSIANFKLRTGMRVGVMVTLRGDRLWQFLDRLMNAALPRVRDFHGVPRDSFDGRGNYTLGIAEQVVFPEIDYNRIDRLRGLQVTVVTSAKTDEEGRRLLELLGMPYVRVDQPVVAA